MNRKENPPIAKIRVGRVKAKGARNNFVLLFFRKGDNRFSYIATHTFYYIV